MNKHIARSAGDYTFLVNGFREEDSPEGVYYSEEDVIELLRITYEAGAENSLSGTFLDSVDYVVEIIREVK